MCDEPSLRKKVGEDWGTGEFMLHLKVSKGKIFKKAKFLFYIIYPMYNTHTHTHMHSYVNR